MSFWRIARAAREKHPRPPPPEAVDPRTASARCQPTTWCGAGLPAPHVIPRLAAFEPAHDAENCRRPRSTWVPRSGSLARGGPTHSSPRRSREQRKCRAGCPMHAHNPRTQADPPDATASSSRWPPWNGGGHASQAPDSWQDPPKMLLEMGRPASDGGSGEGSARSAHQRPIAWPHCDAPVAGLRSG